MSEGKTRAPRPTIEQDGQDAAGAVADKSAHGAEGAAAPAGAQADATGTASAAGAAGETGEATEKPGRGWRRRKRSERVPGAVSAHAAREALADADETFTCYAASHKNTVLFGFLGLALALLIIFLGFWRTLLIALFVLIGVIIGQALDGDNGIINFFRQYFGGR